MSAQKYMPDSECATPVEVLRKSRSAIIAVGVFSVFLNLLVLAGPLYMLQVYDRVLISGSMQTLVILTILVAVMFAVYSFIESVRSGLLVHISARFERELAPVVFDIVQHQSLVSFGAREGRPVRDLAELRQFIAGPALRAFFDLPLAPIFFLVLFLMHWSLGLLALGGAVILCGLALYTQKASRPLVEQSNDLTNDGAVFAQATWRGAEVVRALGMQRTLRGRWIKKTSQADEMAVQVSGIINDASAATKGFRMFLQSALLGAGAVLALKGVATPGVIIAGSIIGARMVTPIEQIASQWRQIIRARASWRRLNMCFDGLEPASGSRIDLPPIKGALHVENMFAPAPAQTKPFLQAVTFSMEPGEVVGVLGPSGSGKTSLARVVSGIWPYSLGAVRIDGAELSAYDPDTLGRQIGYLPQSIELLPGTVGENIARMKTGETSQGVIEAAEAANAHQMILSLKGGYETPVGPGGLGLSAGQRQRIGLARALYGDPKLVVLDEPNSNLDHDGDEALSKTIASLKANGVAVLIIGHRPSTLRHADKILVLKEGKVQAFGGRDEVLGRVLAGQNRGAARVQLVDKKGAET